MLDPALLDAVQSVARGNPALDPGSATSPSGSPTSSPSAKASGGSSSSSDPSGSSSSAEPGSDGSGDTGSSAAPSSEAKAARAWLEEFRAQAPTHTVAALPYGDLDVASVLSGPLPAVYQKAVALSSQALAGYGVDHPVPVVAPASGFLPETALLRVGTGTPVVLG